MSELVRALKAEHRKIIKLLHKAADAGVETDLGRMTLLAAKRRLLVHLRTEDDELYPVLLKSAKDDTIIGDALDFFDRDIKHVTHVASALFEKAETNTEGLSEEFDANLYRFLGRRS